MNPEGYMPPEAEEEARKMEEARNINQGNELDDASGQQEQEDVLASEEEGYACDHALTCLANINKLVQIPMPTHMYYLSGRISRGEATVGEINEMKQLVTEIYNENKAKINNYINSREAQTLGYRDRSNAERVQEWQQVISGFTLS